uniref:DnaJ-class molecular chaperone n=1 Tax=Magnetospirillum gryphiswaldense TaxID=55518 RepID=A4TWM8_9PROT|nr:DnaJ-class molecular chaperone [Magnetospirillum gryphiswaldense MSR-1]
MDGTKQEQGEARSVSVVKHSYTIPCSSAFRDAIEALAARRHVNVGDIARSVLLVMPPSAIQGFPDPGDPEAGDRETVILKSGPSQGRPWWKPMVKRCGPPVRP